MKGNPSIFGYKCIDKHCNDMFFSIAMLHIKGQFSCCPKCGCPNPQFDGMYELATPKKDKEA